MNTNTIIFTILIGLIIPFIAVFCYFKGYEIGFNIFSVACVLELVIISLMTMSSNAGLGILYVMAMVGIAAGVSNYSECTIHWKSILLGASSAACTTPIVLFIALSNMKFSCGGN